MIRQHIAILFPLRQSTFTKAEAQPATAELQYMITQRMRRILQDDLNYLPEEVDVMEPQIAAAVIEKNLGMTWEVTKFRCE